MNFRHLFLAVISLTFTTLGFSQSGFYSFDDCTLVDQSGTYGPANTIFDPSCDCGLVADGLYFDGSNDNLFFPEALDSLMEEDFTISFYFRFDQVSTKTDLFSVRSECALDSFIAVTYNPANNEVSLELAKNIGNISTESAELDPTLCWHRIVLTKSNLFYTLYLDDVEVLSILANGNVEFDDNARLSLSSSPCLAVNIDRFNGWIDEFNFHQRAFSGIEVVNSSLNPDMILNNDTTIVAGAPVDILVGPTCANNFTWSPSEGLDDTSILDPIATPTITTQYALTIDNEGNCTTTDILTINVIDPEALECDKLLLPNAFTPNNDQLNDRYGISNIFLIDELEYFEIYDRWGGKMWTTNTKTETWDGSFDGDAVNPGMYLYKVKYTCGDEEFVKVDNFSVLR